MLTTNQGLILPDGTDNANVPLTFTDFVTTAGSGMENRLVQRYLSTADRTARNPAPNEGEISYLIDLNTYDTYTGASWAPLSKGFINALTRSVNSAGVTTTETVIDFVTFTAVAGARYKLSWSGNVRGTTTGDIARMLFRFQAGGTLTTAGSLFNSILFPIVTNIAGTGISLSPFATITGIAPGTTSIGVTLIRNSGAGTLTSLGSPGSDLNQLLLEVI